MTEMPKIYDAKLHEKDIYKSWEDAGCFKAGAGKREEKPSYTIAIPPPNVTGVLHMGHALNNSLQDTLVRFNRMRGHDTLWQPGTDHAGIATQSVVAKALDKEGGPSREEMGRDKFIDKIWDWKEEYGSSIVNQLRKLGSSCDWSRERFTMDEGLSDAVRKNFVKLYEAGLIYRGTRMVNWSPALQTALSNDEVDSVDCDGFMWKMKYELEDGSGFIEVETTRPETFFGDTAVAVNPEDERYKDMIGKMVVLPIIGRKIPVVGDDYANPEKGTGAVKITPAHDPNDYEVGKRNNLELITVMNLDGTMNSGAASYEGMDRFECRAKLLVDLKEQGVLIGETKISHAVGHCYRSHVPVEPMVTKQWFVKMKPLAERAIKETEEGRVNFYPKRWTKVYLKWLEEVQDWCISRQIWWGHRIPVWYDEDGEIIVSESDPTKDEKYAGKKLTQDNDVLDTWFSSALWPFSTLGWPDENDEAFKTYFPTNTLVTDRGIIYFWVARMVMMSLFNLDIKPFRDVYIHGTVLDETGTKMSKSLGNGIDPLIMIEGGTQSYLGKDFVCDGYGADAIRYTLLDMTTEGQDLKLSPQRFESGRNFVNKIFNAGRFLLMNLEGKGIDKDITLTDIKERDLGYAEKWLLHRLQLATKNCASALDNYRFSEYANSAYHFFRDDLCDWYLEWAKSQFKIGGKTAKTSAMILFYAFEKTLRLLHPGMPFITEYLWKQLKTILAIKTEAEHLMITEWIDADETLIDESLDEKMKTTKDLVIAVRNIRAKQKLPDKTKLLARIITKESLSEQIEFITDRANLSALEILTEKTNEVSLDEVVGDTIVSVPVKDSGIDMNEYISSLNKQLDSKEKAANGKRGRLSNDKYINNAPADKVQETRDMLKADEEEIEKIKQTIASLQG